MHRERKPVRHQQHKLPAGVPPAAAQAGTAARGQMALGMLGEGKP